MKSSSDSTAAAQKQTPWPLGDGAAAPAGSFRTQLGRVAHHRWLVLAITLVATFGAAGYATLQGSTYTGTSALTVSSGSGNPTGDAAVAQGYVEYFNQVFVNSPAAGQSSGLAGADLSARTSATSSIVYISATARNAQLAGRSAAAAAQAFRDTVNTGLQQNVDRTVADLIKQRDAVKRSFGSEPPNQSGLVSAQIDSLQNEIVQVQSNGSRNQLQDLKLDPVVSSSGAHLTLNAALGLVGGLILGVVVALALGGIEDRLITPEDVRRRLGLDTLASITARTGNLRAIQLSRLAAVVDLASATHPTTLAVTSVRRTPTSGQIAEWVAAVGAQQGQRTLLINADLEANDRPDETYRPGLDAFLTRPDVELRTLVVPGVVRGMRVLPAGTPSESYGLFRSDRWEELVRQAGQLADIVIITTPPCAEKAEAHAICAAADKTILVLEEAAVRARDAAEVCSSLGRVGATVWGAVITDPRMSGDQAPVASRPADLGTPDRPQPTPRPRLTAGEDRSNGARPPEPADGASERV